MLCAQEWLQQWGDTMGGKMGRAGARQRSRSRVVTSTRKAEASRRRSSSRRPSCIPAIRPIPEDGLYSYGRSSSPGFSELERASRRSGACGRCCGRSMPEFRQQSPRLPRERMAPRPCCHTTRTTAFARVPPRSCHCAESRCATSISPISMMCAKRSEAHRSSGPKPRQTPCLPLPIWKPSARCARNANIPWFCDNTFATPIAQNPLDFGAAGAMHSVTKYIGGHSDLILGAVAVNDPALAARLRGRRGDVGTQPDGFTCWLARRGSQTLAVRFQRQCENALELAKRLDAHPSVEHVFYPGLPAHPGHETARKQMRGYFGAMLSFVAKGGQEAAQHVVDRCEIFVPATSLGGRRIADRAPRPLDRRIGAPGALALFHRHRGYRRPLARSGTRFGEFVVRSCESEAPNVSWNARPL